jgi:hypothetical protein
MKIKKKDENRGWLQPPLWPVWGWSNHPNAQGGGSATPKRPKKKKKKKNGLKWVLGFWG